MSLKDKVDAQAREIRLAVVPVEIRAEEGSEAIKVAGYAAVFNERADIGGYFEERIAPGAFDEALARGDDCCFLIDHRGLPLARTSSGTLALSVDARGLKIETDLDPSDPDVARIVPKMKRGDLSKMSFGFRAKRTSWDETVSPPLRTIESVELFDVSIVTDPAYAGTEIALRGLDLAAVDAAQVSEERAARAVDRMRRRARLAGI